MKENEIKAISKVELDFVLSPHPRTWILGADVIGFSR